MRWPSITYSPPIDQLENGNVLKENCTHCHRGDNAFPIHPGTHLDQGSASRANQRYTPTSSQDGWVNPPAFMPQHYALDTCTQCHSIGEIASAPIVAYCATILKQAAVLTMPPSGAVGWDPPASDPFNADMAAIARECGI